MSTMRMEPSEVRSIAGSFRTQAGNVQDVIAAMDSLLGQLQGVFEGATIGAFTGRFEELKPGFQKTVELIEEIATGLDTTANTWEETDAQTATQWQG